MNPQRKAAREFTAGVIDVLAATAFLIASFAMLANCLDLGIDPTDKDGWHRSGLQHYKDYGTGREYISAPGGPLLERPMP